MYAKAVGKMFLVVIALILLGLMMACAGMEFAPRDPYMYWYYPKELPQADRDLEKVREACPQFYKEEKAKVDRAYEEYAACKCPDIKVRRCPASLSLNIRFPFDRPKEMGDKKFPHDDPETWFDKPEAIDPKDALDPCKNGQNEPLENNLTQLKKAVDFVKNNPGTNIKVTGHTDCLGSAEHNAKLSDRRAHAVAAYLRKELGLKNISWKGIGSSEPVSDCDQYKQGKCDRGACDCRAKNRRVVISVSPR